MNKICLCKPGKHCVYGSQGCKHSTTLIDNSFSFRMSKCRFTINVLSFLFPWEIPFEETQKDPPSDPKTPNHWIPKWRWEVELGIAHPCLYSSLSLSSSTVARANTLPPTLSQSLSHSLSLSLGSSRQVLMTLTPLGAIGWKIIEMKITRVEPPLTG